MPSTSRWTRAISEFKSTGGVPRRRSGCYHWEHCIVYNPKVPRRVTDIVRPTANNSQMLLRQIDLWRRADLYARGFWSRWIFFSEQAAAQNHDRQCQKHFIHIHTSKRINSRRLKAKKPRSTAIRGFWLRLVRSHPRFCETDEPEKSCHWVQPFAV